jgi:hypothetical protein
MPSPISEPTIVLPGWSTSQHLHRTPMRRPRRNPSKFPKTDVLSHIEVADGRIWLLPEGIDSFAGDLSEQEKKLVWATQCVPAPDLFDAKVEGTAWKSKPSWYIVAKNDHTIQLPYDGQFGRK